MYDIIIIGAGSAGISAYKEAIKHTQNILIVNDGPWDTTCARVGCMPSKVLISSANRMYDIQNTEGLGLTVKSEIDTSQVMVHVQKLRDRFTAATVKDVNNWPTEHKISGKASFENKNTIVVNGIKYQSKSFIIAVGSTPTYDQAWKDELGDRLITSDQIFELDNLPASIGVVGSGVIAIELAQAMHRLGVKTTVFARSRKVGALSSPSLQELAQNILSKELTIKFEVLPEQVQKTKDGLTIQYIENQEKCSIEVEYLLVATGRRSHLDTLNLSNVSESFSDLKNLAVDTQTKQLADFPIFIIGDAFTSTPLQHEASHEGRGAVYNCLNYPQLRNLKTLTPIGIVFSSPEMASVGQNYKQLKHNNIDFVTGFVSYEKQGRALVLAKNKGAVEVYIDRETRRILGAELFVASAEHMAHLLALAISRECTLDDLLDQPYYHPTLEEGLRTALKHARRQLETKK